MTLLCARNLLRFSRAPVRMALGAEDRHRLNLAGAPADGSVKEKDEWRYWQADLLLLERGRDDETKAILRSLMQQRGFYLR